MANIFDVLVTALTSEKVKNVSWNHSNSIHILIGSFLLSKKWIDGQDDIVNILFCFLVKYMENKNYNRFQVTMHLFNNFFHRRHQNGENICEKNLAVALWVIFVILLHFVTSDWQYWSWGVLSKINRHVCHIHNFQDIAFDISHTMSFWWHAIGTDYQYFLAELWTLPLNTLVLSLLE